MEIQLTDLQARSIKEWDGKSVLYLYPNGMVGTKTFVRCQKDEFDSTEYDIAMDKLDKMGVPRKDESNGETYSIVGRLEWFEKKMVGI